MNEELKKLLAGLNGTWEQMKSALAEAKTKGGENAEAKEKIEKMEKDMQAYEEKMTKVEAALNRPPAVLEAEQKAEEAKADKEQRAYHDVFMKVMSRKGNLNKLTQEEAKLFDKWQEKTMVLADDTSAGYLAPPQLEAEIIKNAVEFSPIRQLATIRTINGRILEQNKKTAAVAATWLGENNLPTAGDMKFGKLTFPANKLGALYKASPDAVEDITVLEAEVREDLSEQFNLAEGTGFISGTGVKQPEGLLTNSDVGGITTDVAGKMDFIDLIDLQAQLKEIYLSNARWLLNRLVLAELRKIQDNNGNFIWSPAVVGLAPASILGYPYTLATDMASTIVTGGNPIMFGDFRRGYKIVDRRGITVQILVEKYLPDTGYFATKRIGGGVVLPEALKKITIK